MAINGFDFGVVRMAQDDDGTQVGIIRRRIKDFSIGRGFHGRAGRRVQIDAQMRPGLSVGGAGMAVRNGYGGGNRA